MADQTLLEVINDRIAAFEEARIPKRDRKYRYLLKLQVYAANGIVLSMADRDFLNRVQPDRRIPRCEHCSPTGKCPIGLGDIGDRCPHWGGWWKSKVTCTRYEEETAGPNRFRGGV